MYREDYMNKMSVPNYLNKQNVGYEHRDLVRLEILLKEKLEECRSYVVAPKTFENSADDMDNAVNEHLQSHNLAISKKKQEEADTIVRALESLRKGDYGICEGCGKDIPVKRLMAMPMTTLCVICKAKEECA